MAILRIASKFLAVGALSTAIEVAVFNLITYGIGVDPVAAKFGASAIALTSAYLGNQRWTFRERGHSRSTWVIARFLATNAMCTVFGAVVVWLAVYGIHLQGALLVNAANLAAVALTALVRFGAYHWWVFRSPLLHMRINGDDRPVPAEGTPVGPLNQFST